MPIETLLPDLQSFVLKLEDDLRSRASSVGEIGSYVDREYAQAKQAGRTGEAREEFQEQLFTQGAVAWVLSSVFVRFLEDNGFLDERDGTVHRWLGGHEPRYVDVAKDTERLYFEEHPRESERDYLIHVFEAAKNLPGLDRLFDPKHNALWHLPISADVARDLLALLRRTEPETGEPVHAFDDASLDTRFLGDLYQDLSESARKRYALLQTPEFVEEFILDYTLEPAIEEFGYSEVRLIDPACGSGHFLLGAFKRLVALHQRHEPAVNERELVQRALAQVAGVDLNPFAVAIARFRLLVAALRESGVKRLADAPGFEVHVAAGDSLLHGRRPGSGARSGELFEPDERAQKASKGFDHYFAAEDRDFLRELLNRQYHAVVGNPPYITVKDKQVNELYRDRYESCYMQYSLVCPFLERFFDLGLPPQGASRGAGFVGAIVSNSFAKRNFGRRLIERVLPSWDTTHVIDTSGAYIPGHFTPTLMIFARHRVPLTNQVRAALGIRGEPNVPEQPSRGRVWLDIVAQISNPGGSSDFISVEDVDRSRFERHPWSLQGGGAFQVMKSIEAHSKLRLRDLVEEIGYGAVTRENDAYIISDRVAARSRIPQDQRRIMVAGEDIRDWLVQNSTTAIWPYDPHSLVAYCPEPVGRFLWPLRRRLTDRVAYGMNQLERGLEWFEYSMFFRERFRSGLLIAFASISTHNHFVLDRGGSVYMQSAPVIKLPSDASEERRLALAGILNSSLACFWMKQIFYPKASAIGDISKEKMKAENNRYEIQATGLLDFPVAIGALEGDRVMSIASELESLSRKVELLQPARVIPTCLSKGDGSLQRELVAAAEGEEALRARMVALQEELDWEIYSCYGLSPEGASDDVVSSEVAVAPRDRPAFWTDSDGPAGHEATVADLYRRRRELGRRDKAIRMIETPVSKRLWLGQQGVFGHREADYLGRARIALRRWLLDRLEAGGLWSEARLTSVARLADRIRQDRGFLQVAALYRGHEDFDLTKLVTELVEAEGVFYLAAYRYKPSGLRKRKVWERVWDLQRQEDALDAQAELPSGHPNHLPKKEAEKRKAALDIPVPPRYKSADFAGSTTWRHRGKLDVPKEQFILYPRAEREADPTPVLGWAGWDHLQQAQALATYYTEMRDTEGWPKDRLLPLLAGLAELLPWLRQWHNDHDPSLGMGMGDHFASFLDEEARRQGVTLQDVEELRFSKP